MSPVKRAEQSKVVAMIRPELRKEVGQNGENGGMMYTKSSGQIV
jgi:hypothetical protein